MAGSKRNERTNGFNGFLGVRIEEGLLFSSIRFVLANLSTRGGGNTYNNNDNIGSILKKWHANTYVFT